MIQNILKIAQVVLAILLIVSILLQQKGSDLGVGFGGGSGPMVTSRRGADLFLFKLTIAISLLFFGVALASIILV